MNPQLNGEDPYEAKAKEVLATAFRLPEINNQDAAQKLEPCIYVLPDTDNVIKAASELITREAKTDKGRANEMFKNLQYHLASICLATEAYILFDNEGNDKEKQKIISFLRRSNNTARDIYNLALDRHLFITQNTNFQTLPYYATYLDSLENIYNKLKKDLNSQTSTGWLSKLQGLSSKLSNLLNHPPRPVAPIAIAMAPDQNQALEEEEIHEADAHQDRNQGFTEEDGGEMAPIPDQNQDQAPEEEAYGADDSQNQGFEYQPPFIGFLGNDSSEESTSPVLSSTNNSQMSIAVGPVPQSTYATPDEELAGKWEYMINFKDMEIPSNPEYLGGGSFGTTYRMLLPNRESCVVKLIKDAEAFIHEFTVNMVLKDQAMNIINSLRAGNYSEQNIFLFECLHHLVACYSNPQIPLTATPAEMKGFLEGNIDKFKYVTRNGDTYYPLIFEYVEGTTLFKAVQSNPTMSFEVLQMRIKLLGQLCRALSFLDYAGIVHMDFKNDNVMITTLNGIITAQSIIKLLDLGMAFLLTNMILFENPLLERTFYSMAFEMLTAIQAGKNAETDEIFPIMEKNFDKINIFPLWRIAFSILFWKDGLSKVDYKIVKQMDDSGWDINTAVALDKEFRPNIEQNLNELNTIRNRTWDWNPPFWHTQTYPLFDTDTINRLLELLVRISVDDPKERMSAVDAFAFIQDEILPNMIPYQIPEENKEEEEAKDAA